MSTQIFGRELGREGGQPLDGLDDQLELLGRVDPARRSRWPGQ
jgi:hypothetical protein